MCADIEQQEMVSLSNIIQCVIHFEKKFSELLLFYVLYNTNNLRKKREKAKTIEAGAAYLAILTAEKNQNYEEIHCKI